MNSETHSTWIAEMYRNRWAAIGFSLSIAIVFFGVYIYYRAYILDSFHHSVVAGAIWFLAANHIWAFREMCLEASE